MYNFLTVIIDSNRSVLSGLLAHFPLSCKSRRVHFSGCSESFRPVRSWYYLGWCDLLQGEMLTAILSPGITVLNPLPSLPPSPSPTVYSGLELELQLEFNPSTPTSPLTKCFTGCLYCPPKLWECKLNCTFMFLFFSAVIPFALQFF